MLFERTIIAKSPDYQTKHSLVELKGKDQINPDLLFLE